MKNMTVNIAPHSGNGWQMNLITQIPGMQLRAKYSRDIMTVHQHTHAHASQKLITKTG